MNTFWRFARQMLVHRWMLSAALALSVLASAGFGAGLAGMAPILGTMMPKYEQVEDASGEIRRVALETKTIQSRAVDLNTRMADWPVKVQIPRSWINSLPTDPYRGIVFIMIGIGDFQLMVPSALTWFGGVVAQNKKVFCTVRSILSFMKG